MEQTREMKKVSIIHTLMLISVLYQISKEMKMEKYNGNRENKNGAK